jgi:uncharacterized membrane protein
MANEASKLDVWSRKLIVRILERIFIDSIVLHRFWRCHRISGRSFFLRGRQFHVCARCTGIICGFGVSPLALLFRADARWLFVVLLCANIFDAVSQLARLRTSNNWLRFGLGSGLGYTFLPTLSSLAR